MDVASWCYKWEGWIGWYSDGVRYRDYKELSFEPLPSILNRLYLCQKRLQKCRDDDGRAVFRNNFKLEEEVNEEVDKEAKLLEEDFAKALKRQRLL